MKLFEAFKEVIQKYLIKPCVDLFLFPINVVNYLRAGGRGFPDEYNRMFYDLSTHQIMNTHMKNYDLIIYFFICVLMFPLLLFVFLFYTTFIVIYILIILLTCIVVIPLECLKALIKIYEANKAVKEAYKQYHQKLKEVQKQYDDQHR